MGGQRHAPTALPPGKTRYTLYRRLGGPQGRFGRVRNSPPRGFDPRTVQPVAIRYIDCAIPPTHHTHTYILHRPNHNLVCFHQHVQAKAEYSPATLLPTASTVPLALQCTVLCCYMVSVPRRIKMDLFHQQRNERREFLKNRCISLS